MIYFETKDVIENAQDFTRELLLYKERERNDLCIVEEGMKPVVELNGKKYICLLENPKEKTISKMTFTAVDALLQNAGPIFVYLQEIED